MHENLLSNMKGIYLAILLAICTHVFLAIGIEGPQCFHFTWPGAKDDLNYCREFNKNNSFTPCIDQVYISETKPNTKELWDHWNKIKNFTYVKKMESSNVCVKFTYIYNGAVVNVSYFPGKVTEDRIMSITSGCYVQYTDGYSIEACACKSKDHTMPCNSTIRNVSSILIISVVAAITLFTYKIFDIP